MTCRCDDHDFPRETFIGAGLVDLPRQIAIFAEWRDALLDGVGTDPRLAGWRGREDDLGLLYLEFAAYVLDLCAFIHMAHAQETLLRTSRLPTSTRRLVALLGYRPRPAVAAFADLALTVSGGRPVVLPVGTAFRSEATDESPPQTFELDAPATVHPLRSRWKLGPLSPVTFGSVGSGAPVATSHDALLFRPGTVTASVGAPLLVTIGTSRQVQFLAADAEYRSLDGKSYRRLSFDAPVSVPAGTATASLRVEVAASAARLWTRNSLTNAISGAQLTLDGLNSAIEVGAPIVLRRGGDLRWFTVQATAVATPVLAPEVTSALTDKDGNDAGTLTSAAITGVATQVTLDADVNARKSPGWTDWTSATAPEIIVLHGFRPAGELVQEAGMSAAAGATLKLAAPARNPGLAANRLMLEDVDGRGAALSGLIDFATGKVALDPGAAWPEQPLTPPLKLFGNVVKVSRGESVRNERLGSGDASAARLRFKLQKKPLTYLPGSTPENDWGLSSTLTVWVGGVRWTEVPSFFGQSKTAEVFTIEFDDEENTFVVFGGGARPASGVPITADYRFGAGAAKPPAGGIRQLAKPTPNLGAVRDPAGAYGGADRESQTDLRTLAPRSALLLGRAVSVLDFEVAAASTPGVRGVKAEWRWSTGRQEPVVEVAFIGSPTLAPTVLDRLKSQAEPSAPIDAVAALAVPKRISLQIEIAEAYSAPMVVTNVRTALIGDPEALLSPERLGVGRALFRSVVFAAALAVPGVVAVRDLRLDGAPMGDYGVQPGAAAYFDFETGGVVVNGDDGNV